MESIDHIFEGLANWVGAGDLLAWVKRNIFKMDEMDPVAINEKINNLILENKTNANAKLSDLANVINNLTVVVKSPATKTALNNAMKRARTEYQKISKSIDIATQYETAANALNSQITAMSKSQRTNPEASDLRDRALKYAREARETLASATDTATNYEKGDQIGGSNVQKTK